MKKLLLSVLLVLTFSNSVEFSSKLPMEMKQLVESFDCFNKRDRTAIYSYALSLQYRLEHIKDKEALRKSDLDYWRLWHIVSDIESSCKLSYDFDNILEEILFPTVKLKKQLKRLRWTEGAIRTEGSSESSARMRSYDKKLLDGIMKSPPIWSIEGKNKYLGDYNLTTMKLYPVNTIASKDYVNITEVSKEKSKERRFLLRYAYLQEQYLRYYDQPKKRSNVSTELSYLSSCFEYYHLNQHSTYYGNEKRELAGRVLYGGSINTIYGKEMLPQDIKKYCDYNVTKIELGTFNVIANKSQKSKVLKLAIPSFKKARTLIEGYQKSGTNIHDYKGYLTLAKKMLEGGGNDLSGGLRLLRLEQCLRTDNINNFQAFLTTALDDMKEQNYKDEFYNRVVRPKMWWMTTIGMKIEQEGELEELKHFFDCNATVLTPLKRSTLSKKKTSIHSRNKKRNSDIRISHTIIDYKDQILKYYAATFVNTPTPYMNNKKAIKAGIIPARWIEDNKSIKSVFGIKIEINGMPKGGVKFTFNRIPKGEICERIMTLNISKDIFFDHKTYDGLDYYLIDGNKIKMEHYNVKYAKRLCDKKEMHTISFVREKMIIERKYKPKSTDCSNDKYKKITTLDTRRYNPNGFAVSGDHKYFALSGSKSAWYDATIPTIISTLPKQLDNAFYLTISEEGDRIAVSKGRGFSLFNPFLESMITKIGHKDPMYKPFSLRALHFLKNENYVVGISEKAHKVRILDPENRKVITETVPRFFDGEKKSRYRKTRIASLALSGDSSYVYIGSNSKKLEIWKISNGFLGLGSLCLTYQDTIELPEGREIGAIAPDPLNSTNIYIAMRNDSLYLYDISTKSIRKRYIADSFMDPKSIEISDNGKFIMVRGSSLFIWKKSDVVQWDIFTGSGIKGGLFIPGTTEIISAGRTVDHWRLR
ncbi:MAG: hypothetical protein GQ531_00860 [Sulfurovum sp.]|nr:hypothetical protein [Sulfurovum sp.]